MASTGLLGRLVPELKTQQVRRLLEYHHRGIAVIMLLFGLGQWATIVGVFTARGGIPFPELIAEQQVAIMNLAAADLVAAVGLWMLVPWGTVIWVYAAIAEIVMHTLFADAFGPGMLTVAFHLVAIAAYAVLRLALSRAIPSRGG